MNNHGSKVDLIVGTFFKCISSEPPTKTKSKIIRLAGVEVFLQINGSEL